MAEEDKIPPTVQMSNLRQQSALCNSDTPIVVKIGNEYHRVIRVFPDTAGSPVGESCFVIEVSRGPFLKVY